MLLFNRNLYGDVNKSMNVKNKTCTALCVVASIMFLLATAFTILQISINNREYFRSRQAELMTHLQTGMSQEDNFDAFMRMIDYMEGRIDTIQVEKEVDGVVREVYNEQEVLHMIDVRNLYKACGIVRFVFFALSAVLIIVSAIIVKSDFVDVLARGYIIGVIILLIIIACLGIYAAIDFDSFWTSFHKIFFTNDLWLFDYSKSLMIRMCPLELFSGIIVFFTVPFVGIMVLFLIIAIIIKRRRYKNAES